MRVTHIPPRPTRISPREIRRIRRALNASQMLFASYLNVSPNAVRSWEQGTRRPRQAAPKLLTIAGKNARALLVASAQSHDQPVTSFPSQQGLWQNWLWLPGDSAV